MKRPAKQIDPLDEKLANLNRWPIKYREQCARILNQRARLLDQLQTDKQRKLHTKIGDKVYLRLSKIDDDKADYWDSHISKPKPVTSPNDLHRIGRGQ